VQSRFTACESCYGRKTKCSKKSAYDEWVKAQRELEQQGSPAPSASSEEGSSSNVPTGGAAIITTTSAAAPIASGLGQLGATSISAHVTRSRVHASRSEVGPTESNVGPDVSSPIFDFSMIAEFWTKFHLTTTPGVSPEPPSYSPVASGKPFLYPSVVLLNSYSSSFPSLCGFSGIRDSAAPSSYLFGVYGRYGLR
jgi:hypothetical protein